MSKVKNAAVVLDDAVCQLAEAYELFVDACRAEDRKFRAERKTASDKWPKNPRSQKGAQNHPIYSEPAKMLRAALAGKQELAWALRMGHTQVESVADLVPDAASGSSSDCETVD